MNTDAERLAVLKHRSYELLLANRRYAAAHQYTVPSPDTYPYQWLWDSCFHAIVLAHFNVDDAKKEMRSLISKQLGNGMIPHMIYWQRTAAIDIDWGRPDTSSITQPPLLSTAVRAIYEKDGDKEFLKEMYPAMYHFYNYFLTERDPRGNHLMSIINPDESGEDNSPRFDHAMRLPPRHTLNENFAKRVELIARNKTCNFDAPFCMKQHFWIKDVPFNAIFVQGLADLAHIADTIDMKEDALRYEARRTEVMGAMRDRMFKEGLFWTLEGPEYEIVPVKTWAVFSPLFARILTDEEASRLVNDTLLNESEFWAPWGVRTVSKTEPSYDPKGFWRGPVWFAVHWFLYRGLVEYGLFEPAEKIRNISLRLIEERGFFEQFHPETGEALGARNFTWGTLVVDMFERATGASARSGAEAAVSSSSSR